MILYRVEFWGGPRCGDEAYQLALPPQHYYIPASPMPDLKGILKVAVQKGEPPKGEAHHYELVEMTPNLDVLFKYRGVVCGTKD